MIANDLAQILITRPSGLGRSLEGSEGICGVLQTPISCHNFLVVGFTELHFYGKIHVIRDFEVNSQLGGWLFLRVCCFSFIYTFLANTRVAGCRLSSLYVY